MERTHIPQVLAPSNKPTTSREYGLAFCARIGVEICKILNTGIWADALKQRCDELGVNRENFLAGNINKASHLPIPNSLLDTYLNQQGMIEVDSNPLSHFTAYLEQPIPNSIASYITKKDDHIIYSALGNNKLCPKPLIAPLKQLLNEIVTFLETEKSDQLSLFGSAKESTELFKIYQSFFHRYLMNITSGFVQAPIIAERISDSTSLQEKGIENTSDYSRLKNPFTDAAEKDIKDARELPCTPILTNSGRSAFKIAFDTILKLLNNSNNQNVNVLEQKDMYFEVNQDVSAKARDFPQILTKKTFNNISECLTEIDRNKPNIIVIGDVANDAKLTKLNIDELISSLSEHKYDHPLHIIIDTSLTCPKSKYYDLLNNKSRALLSANNIHVTTIESLSKLGQGGLNRDEGGGLILTGPLATLMLNERGNIASVPQPQSCLMQSFLATNFETVQARATAIFCNAGNIAKKLAAYFETNQHPVFVSVHHPFLKNDTSENCPILTIEINPQLTDLSPMMRDQNIQKLKDGLIFNSIGFDIEEGASFGYDKPRFCILTTPSSNPDFPLRYYLRLSPGLGDIEKLYKAVAELNITK